ncbi:MAG: leucine-rich repeat protein [Bacteroidales bacterium]|nr:leucine-rich repeat protein [Bacteroidales bacterium]
MLKLSRFRLLLWAVLLLTGWTSASATEFISKDFMLGCSTNKSTAEGYLTSAGYTVISGDLNASCGENTNYIFLGIKETTDASQAVTDMAIWSGGDAPSSFTHDNKTYYKITKCAGYDTNYGDLNKGVGGEYLYLYYTTDGNTTSGTSLLTGISVEIFGSSQSNSNYVDYAGNSGGKDCNAGAGGDYIYIKKTKGHTHSTSCRIFSPFKHEHYCPGCDYTYSTEEHSFVDGVCSECGYNEATAPLTFIANTAGSTVTLAQNGTPYGVYLQYSTDYKTWNTYTIGTTIPLDNVNDFVLFRSYVTRSQFSTDINNYYQYQLTGSVAATGNIMTLFDADGSRTSTSEYALYRLFYGQTALTSAPYLPATTLADNCYQSMFEGCTNLTSAPALPAKKLAEHCYESMFYSCTGLTSAPALPATSLSTSCYRSMFYGCKSLTSAPALPADTLADYCYYSMFSGCKGLTSAPALPADTLADYCYYSMFSGCKGLTSAPALPADTLADYCYYSMFSDCTGLTSAPALPADTLASYCYAYMFSGCTGLTIAPALPATTLSDYCYAYMFTGCTSLNEVSVAFTEWTENATEGWLTDVAEEGIFVCPTALPRTRGNDYIPTDWNVPEYLTFTAKKANSYVILLKSGGPADVSLQYSTDGLTWSDYTIGYHIELADSADFVSFRATSTNSRFTINPYHYYRFFLGDSIAASGNIMSLLDKTCQQTSVPEYAFCELFQGESNLISAPALPATTLADSCYYMMFDGCTGLTSAPALPATKLAEGCYNKMFNGCTSLTSAPVLPADSLANYCYDGMFQGCTSLNEVNVAFTSWVAGATEGWLDGVAEEGTFYCPTALPRTRGISYIPEGWDAPEYLTFTAKKGNNYVRLQKGGSPADVSLQYSTDGLTWSDYTIGSTITLADSADFVSFRATSNNSTFSTSISNYYRFELGDSIAASGNVMSLLDKTCQQTSVPEYAFFKLFMNQPKLTSAPSLPATSLAYYCYNYMFYGCTGLTAAPALPATKLASYCYKGMFASCTNLASAPALPATTLAEGCYNGMFHNCISLTDAPALPATKLAEGCYSGMFNDCSNLTNAPALPATSLADGCYSGMFIGCTNLASAPALPATTMADSCYHYMFAGCTNLASAPALPSTSLAGGCYSYMFAGCTNLASAPVLPATTLASNCYRNMFASCTNLASAPALPATSLADGCYSYMFAGCTNLNEVNVAFTSWLDGATQEWLNGVAEEGTFVCPTALPRTRGISYIPEGWDAPEYLTFTAKKGNNYVRLQKTGSPADVSLQYSTDGLTWSDYTIGSNITLTDSADFVSFRATSTNSRFSTRESDFYYFTFNDSVAASGNIMSLLDKTCQQTSVPEYAFFDLFINVMNLTSALTLPATKLAKSCYREMFYGCTSLTSAPALPADTLAEGCYSGMFYGCTSLTSAPALPADTLAIGCYNGMFSDCTSLTSAPALPADSLANSCYCYMFARCTNLTNAPALPADTLAECCYAGMFYGCTSLTSAPALPADTLAEACYESMFYNCTNLTSAPALPADTLAEACYESMFYNCTNLREVKVAFTSWVEGATEGWLEGVAEEGTFVCPTALPRTRGISYIPEGWDVPEYLTFTAKKGNNGVSLQKAGSPADVSLQYSTDGLTWSDYTIGSAITLADSADFVSFRATSTNSRFSIGETDFYKFTFNDSVAASGNIMSLLDKTCQQTSVPECAFYYLFQWNTNLTSAPALPATTLADSCYCNMFIGCTGLTSAPALPATKLANSCYDSMFNGCTSLNSAPALPADSLAEHCYEGMFADCTSLTSAPALPADSLANSCYKYMFYGCTSLNSAPSLPADTLAEGCYNSMFSGCTGLTNAPVLPADTLAEGCYNYMFYGCTNLNEVNVAFTSWVAGATEGWLDGVAEEGTFFGPTALPSTRGISYIPEGWEIVSEIPDYLTFTAKKGDNGVTLIKIGSPADVSLQYSTDGFTWSDYTIGSTIALADSADFVSFRATSTNSRFSTNSSNYYRFVLDDSIAASGNIMSLLDKTCQQTSVPEFAFKKLFETQHTLTQAPALPATTLARYCYHGMFEYCDNLTNAPTLPATTLTSRCYESMFFRCQSLTTAPALPATALADSCYRYMFYGCTSLTSAPDLPATSLTKRCYEYMFKNCTCLTQTPALPADTLAEECYGTMFSDCTSLTQAPALPADSMATGCYYGMFDGCTGLTQAPALPADSLATECYYGMFNDCTGLTQAPALPAETMADSCYFGMFNGCTNLTKAPALIAETLAKDCYYGMYAGCTSLDKVIVNISDADEFAQTGLWLSGAASTGSFVCPSTLDTTSLSRGVNNIPSGWTVEPFLTEVTLNSKGYATYSASVDMVTDVENTAYTCQVEGDEIHCSAIDSIPAGTGALLVGDAGETIRLHMVLDAPAVEDNDLRATTSDSLYVEPMPEEGTNYALNGSKFLRYVGSAFVANKAYFNLPVAIAASAAELRLVFDDLIAEEDETTSVNSISTDDADQTPAFSLQGQRVTTDAKGLQVRNGHVIFKK